MANRKEHRAAELERYRKNKKAVKMANRQLVSGNDPVLSMVCEPVDYGDPSFVRAVIDRLNSTFDGCPTGVELAAPQVGLPTRAILIQPERGTGGKRTIMFNPEIVDRSEEMDIGTEGCLSYPGVRAGIMRHYKITVKWIDPETFAEMTETFIGYAARVLQHEIDHLSGVCLVREYRDGRRDDIVYDPTKDYRPPMRSNPSGSDGNTQPDAYRMRSGAARRNAAMVALALFAGIGAMGKSAVTKNDSLSIEKENS